MSKVDTSTGGLGSPAHNGAHEPVSMVHITDSHVFHALVCSAIRLALKERGPWLVCVDGSTLTHADILASLLDKKTDRLAVFGQAPPPESPYSPEKYELDPLKAPGALFFIIKGESFHFTIFGSPLESQGTEDSINFEGGWTTSLSYTSDSVARLLNEPPKPVNDIENETLTLQLAALHAEVLTQRRRHIARDKADLFAVLDILKSISTKRRAHDVLYVFVEHIARAVPFMRRCSVVRVWGDRKSGQVLASHEDKNLREYSIDLKKYPELRETLQTGETLNITQVCEHPLTKPYADEMAQAKISALLVIPIVLFDEEIGSLLLRAARSEGTFSHREISFCQIAAEAASSALERAQLFDNIQRANERLARLAKTDGLTGLYNYRHFRDRLEEEYSRAIRYDLPLTCMIFDVDNFKNINDTYGHVAGDAVLRAIAQRTLRSIRTLDIVARYGGEEFAIIMPQTDLVGAKVEGERVREAIAECSVEVAPATQVSVTVSVGLAALDPENMVSTDALVHAADAALYEAKRSGKNRVVAK